MTIAEYQKIYRDKLSKIYDAREAAAITKLVFEQVLELNPVKLAFERFRILTASQQENLSKILNQLQNQQPVQYVLGQTEFCGLKLKVDARVLIPRPETEDLVQWILQVVKKSNESPRILDIGTGSGCIAIALSKHLPTAIVQAVDVSEDALQIAKANNQLNATTVQFFNNDILQQPIDDTDYDVIVSNPPYIRPSEKDTLAKHVLDFEPHLALFAPSEDGLIFYRAIAQKAHIALKSGGLLFFEIHASMANEVVATMQEEGYKNITVRNDLSGKERMVRGEK